MLARDKVKGKMGGGAEPEPSLMGDVEIPCQRAGGPERAYVPHVVSYFPLTPSPALASLTLWFSWPPPLLLSCFVPVFFMPSLPPLHAWLVCLGFSRPFFLLGAPTAPH